MYYHIIKELLPYSLTLRTSIQHKVRKDKKN